MNQSIQHIDDTVVGIVNNEREYTIRTKGGHELRLPLAIWVSVKGMREGSNIYIDYDRWAETGRTEVAVSNNNRKVATFGINSVTCLLRKN